MFTTLVLNILASHNLRRIVKRQYSLKFTEKSKFINLKEVNLLLLLIFWEILKWLQNWHISSLKLSDILDFTWVPLLVCKVIILLYTPE